MAKVSVGNPVEIGIKDDAREAVGNDLQTLLSEEFMLYAKLRSFHWNVEGPHFGPLHILFEQQYTALAEIVDQVAERIRQIGLYADGKLSTTIERSKVTEHDGIQTADMDMIRILTEDHETIIRFLRKSIPNADDKYNDAGTADFMTSLMEQHEKMAWMLRAHLM